MKLDSTGSASFIVWRIGRAYKIYPLIHEHIDAYKEHIHYLWKRSRQMRR